MTNFEEKMNVLKEEANKLVGMKFNHRKYSSCEVTDTRCDVTGCATDYNASSKGNVTLVTKLPDGTTKMFDVVMSKACGAVVFEDERVQTVIDLLQEAIDCKFEEMKVKSEELKAEKKKAEEEAERQKKELKFQQMKESAIRSANGMKPLDLDKSFTPTTKYEVLGWIAKHVKSVKAAMPDYLESWFVDRFGQDADRYVVNSSKRTSGGFPIQWALSMHIRFDTEVTDLLLSKCGGKNKKVIDSVQFVWSLIDDYGFKFGKTQDLDEILKYVPDDRLEDFNRGYNA